MLEVVCGRALAAPASRRSAAASTADGSDVRKPAASRGPGACTVLYTVLYMYRGAGEYPDIRRSEISEDFFTVSGSTWTTHTSYLYLPDGKMATIRLTRIALEPTGYTP